MTKRPTDRKTRGACGRPVVDAKRRSHVGSVIRKYRIAASMDQAALAERLGFSKTAVGNWELGLARPDIDTIPRLCKELGIPVTELMGMDRETALSAEERKLLETYRALDDFDRRTVRDLMDRLLFRQDSAMADRLRRSYIPLCLYEEAAAAGIGAPMQDSAENTTVYVLQKNVPHGTDGIIRVNGRSMEPTFMDGSCVYIDSSAKVHPGQVGIFIVNGEAFIKEYRTDGLYSHNARYKPIGISGDSDVRCCGRVTGPVADGDIAEGFLAEKIEAAFRASDGRSGIV